MFLIIFLIAEDTHHGPEQHAHDGIFVCIYVELLFQK